MVRGDARGTASVRLVQDFGRPDDPAGRARRRSATGPAWPASAAQAWPRPPARQQEQETRHELGRGREARRTFIAARHSGSSDGIPSNFAGYQRQCKDYRRRLGGVQPSGIEAPNATISRAVRRTLTVSLPPDWRFEMWCGGKRQRVAGAICAHQPAVTWRAAGPSLGGVVSRRDRRAGKRGEGNSAIFGISADFPAPAGIPQNRRVYKTPHHVHDLHLA